MWQNRDLSYQEAVHFLLSACVGTFVFFLTGESIAFIAALIFGFFVDGDHLVDHLIYTRGKLDIGEFFRGGSFVHTGRVYVILHSYELVILFFLLALCTLTSYTSFWLAAALSLFFHLLFDTYHTKLSRPFSYFLLYRYRKGFDMDLLGFDRCITSKTTA